MPWIEQAIFTSIRGPRLDGYQLAATTQGIGAELAKELTAWGPAHDSLFSPPLSSECLSWFPLSTAHYCLAVTRTSGSEYSGRQGARVYTQFLVVPAPIARQLSNPPWDLYHAQRLAGRLVVRDPLPQRLERCPLSLPAEDRAATASERCELTQQLEASESPEPAPIFVVCSSDANREMESLWLRLPRHLRCDTSFSTGLRWSHRRPFRVQDVPDDAALMRQLRRELHVEPLTFAEAGACRMELAHS